MAETEFGPVSLGSKACLPSVLPWRDWKKVIQNVASASVKADGIAGDGWGIFSAPKLYWTLYQDNVAATKLGIGVGKLS